MRNGVLALLFFIHVMSGHAQTISWSGYTAGSNNYTNGIMTSTLTRTNMNSMGDGTPKFVATDPGAPCYISGSLALYAFFGSSYTSGNSRLTLDLDFTSGAFNGTCHSVQFSIRDINSDESNNTFLDVVEISAIDGFNNPIPAANLLITVPSNTNLATSGNTRIIRGHNSTSETSTSMGSYSSTSCALTNVTVNPPAGVPLKSIRIVYRPGYGTTTSNAYWSFGGPRPAAQYISISNLNLTATAGCTPLPVTLNYFRAEAFEDTHQLKWQTESESNNSHFTLSQSLDGYTFRKLADVSGAGTTNLVSTYQHITDKPNSTNEMVYYKLEQTDFDGTVSELSIVAITTEQNKILIKRINLLGQDVKDDYRGIMLEYYSDGSIKKVNSSAN
jgi:hypothetical protein